MKKLFWWLFLNIQPEKDEYILLVCGKTMQIKLYNRTEIDPQT